VNLLPNLGRRSDLEDAVEGSEAECALVVIAAPIWEVATGVRELKKWHVPGDAVFLHHSSQVLKRL
jgi:hypothetical protein